MTTDIIQETWGDFSSSIRQLADQKLEDRYMAQAIQGRQAELRASIGLDKRGQFSKQTFQWQ